MDNFHFVNTFNEFKEELHKHEMETGTKFILFQTRKTFAKEKLEIKDSMRLFWDKDYPYFSFASRIYACHLGKDKGLSTKRKYAACRDKKAEDENNFKRFNLVHRSKKLGCPARIILKRIIRLPEYKVSDIKTAHFQNKMSQIIKDKIFKEKNVVFEEGFFFNLPTLEDHKYHYVGKLDPIQDDETIIQSLDKIFRLPKNFACSLCSKAFRSKDALNRHRFSHSGLKPFYCDICHQGFSSKVGLKEHKAIHENRKLYQCMDCGKLFRHNSSYHRHLLTHSNKTPHECKICHRQFSQKAYLRSHMAVHTGSKPFTCTLCSKSFSHLSCLKRHKILHSGQRPYKCSVCEAAFADRSSYARHLKLHGVTATSVYYQHHNLANKKPIEFESHICKNQLKNTILNEPKSQTIHIIRASKPNTVEEKGSDILLKKNIDEINQVEIDESKSNDINLFDDNRCHESDTSLLNSENLQNTSSTSKESSNISLVDQLNQNTRDFLNYPDFISQDYYNWLAVFTSQCKLLAIPLEISDFKKISQVHKTLYDALAEPNVVLSKKSNFDALLAICQDLIEIKDKHLKFNYNNLILE